MTKPARTNSPWWWVPSLYYAEGLPYVVVMTVSVVMYKSLGISNSAIAFYTSWLYLPWVLKPLWSPVVDVLSTQRRWILLAQLLIGAAFAGVALTLPADNFFRYSLAVFWLLALSSATHDIAADGFYISQLDDHQQAWFVGIRSTFYRLAMISGQGLLVVLAGFIGRTTDDPRLGWVVTFYLLAGLFVLLFAWHGRKLPANNEAPRLDAISLRSLFRQFAETVISFFQKPHIVSALFFLLTYRFAEAQLVKLAPPFLLDERAAGGLGFDTTEVGIAYGTVGIVMLTLGGILGGFLCARDGFRSWLWWMVAAINLPNAVYILLACTQPQSQLLVNAAVGVEQFGYGFGFTAYMLYMIYISRGEHSTAHFAICTAFMALGMMLPGMFSGELQEALGYQWFFVWILVATVPSFIAASLIRVNENFGRKRPGAEA